MRSGPRLHLATPATTAPATRRRRLRREPRFAAGSSIWTSATGPA